MGISITNIFIVVIIFEIAVSESSTRKADQTNSVTNFINERCRNNVPAEGNYTNKLRELQKYMNGIVIMDRMLPTKKEMYCSNLTQSFIAFSLNNYTQAVMECFPKEEKYIPKFISEGYVEYLNLLCASNGKSIDVLYGSEPNVCTINIKKANVENCESRLVLPLNTTLTKNQLCSDLKGIGKCYNDNLQEHCSNQTNYISVISKISHIIDKPCNAVDDTSEEETK